MLLLRIDVPPSTSHHQHPVETSHLVVYNTDKLVRDIMLPWVKCALLEECINPPGAQNTGCNVPRRPYFLYRGCHRYDMSALNVLLGRAFGSQEELYTADQDLFGSLKLDRLHALNITQPELTSWR